MKMASPASSTNAVAEAQRLLEMHSRNPPRYGAIQIKMIYCNGMCRRLEIKRKTAMQLDAQDGQQS
jgi:hypothetical protein